MRAGSVVWFAITPWHYTQSGYKVVTSYGNAFDSREPTSAELESISKADVETYVCEGCGVSAQDAIGEYDGMETFYCVECQWEDEHDTCDESCKCYWS